MSTPALKVLICDDHELIREGLRRVLTEGTMLGSVGEASNAGEAMEAVRRERWDVVILDINLGGRNGMEVLDEILAEYPRLPILMLSSYPEEQFALRAIRAGASGYLNKNLAARVLIDAIRQVLSGGRYIGPRVADQLFNMAQKPNGAPLHAKLSNREDQVLRLIGVGRTVGEIASQLALSVKTVSTYRAFILRKLGLENSAQIMLYARDHGLS